MTTRTIFKEMGKMQGRKHFLIAEDKNNVILCNTEVKP
jgi:hypothetical protein